MYALSIRSQHVAGREPEVRARTEQYILGVLQQMEGFRCFLTLHEPHNISHVIILFDTEEQARAVEQNPMIAQARPGFSNATHELGPAQYVEVGMFCGQEGA